MQNRRAFFGAVFSGLAGAASAKPQSPKAGGIPVRAFGKTGQKLTIIGMGGARFHLVSSFEEGTAIVRRAYDLGINYFDMARGYWNGHAEDVYGAVIPEFRKNIFLTTKSGNRTRKGAEADLHLSLKRMKTDYVDLWQMHSVGTDAARKEDIDRILAPGGALEAFEAAKKAGKCRFIGFTGHANPFLHLSLLQRCDKFDTIFMPLHAADTAYLSFEKETLPEAVRRGIGVVGMKIFANGYLLRAFGVKQCLDYTLSLPAHVAVLGCSTLGQLEDDVRIAQNFKPLTDEQMDALRARAVEKHREVSNGPALEYWKKEVQP